MRQSARLRVAGCIFLPLQRVSVTRSSERLRSIHMGLRVITSRPRRCPRPIPQQPGGFQSSTGWQAEGREKGKHKASVLRLGDDGPSQEVGSAGTGRGWRRPAEPPKRTAERQCQPRGTPRFASPALLKLCLVFFMAWRFQLFQC